MKLRFFFFVLFTLISVSDLVAESILDFYSEEDKYIEFISEQEERVEVRIYRISEQQAFLEKTDPWLKDVPIEELSGSLKLKQDVGKFFEIPGNTGLDPERGKSLSLKLEIRATVLFQKGKNNFFIPVKNYGLYLIEIKGKKRVAQTLMNITDVSVMVKKDNDRFYIYTQNRMTGVALQGVKIYEPFLNDRFLALTDDQGLYIMNQKKGTDHKMLAQWSNSFTFFRCEENSEKKEKQHKLFVYLNRDYYYPGQKVRLYAFCYFYDRFGELEGVHEGKGTVFFQQKKKDIFFSNGFFSTMEISLGSDFQAGKYQGRFVFGASEIPFQITVLNKPAAGGLLSIDTEKEYYLHGEQIILRGAYRNQAGRKIKGTGFRYEAVFTDLLTGEEVYQTESEKYSVTDGRFIFRFDTKKLPQNDMKVRLRVRALMPSGGIISAFYTVYVLKATETILLKTDKQVYFPDEEIRVSLRLARDMDPYTESKIEFFVFENSDPPVLIEKKYLRLKSRSTNIVIHPNRLGPLILEVRSMERHGGRAQKVIWKADYSRNFDYEPFWPQPFTVIPDRLSYQSGDIARILVVGKQKRVNAFFTMEREKVLFIRNLKIDFNMNVIDVPILEKHCPGVVFSLFTTVSNKSFHEQKEVSVPRLNKIINARMSVFFQPETREYRFWTDNFWGRLVQPVSLFAFKNLNPWFESTGNYDLFNDFYGIPPHGVILQGENTEKENIKKPSKSFCPKVEWNEMIQENQITEEAWVFRGRTNIVQFFPEKYRSEKKLYVQQYGLMEDGKVNSTNHEIVLDPTVNYDFIFPKVFRTGDHPLFTAIFQNRKRKKENLKIITEIITSRNFFYQTNRIPLEPEQSFVYSVPFQDQFDSGEESSVQISFHAVSFEDRFRKDFTIRITDPSLLYTKTSSDYSIRKTIRPLKLNSSGNVQSGWERKTFYSGDEVEITLFVKRKNKSAEETLLIIEDFWPSGFQIADRRFRADYSGEIQDSNGSIRWTLNAPEYGEILKLKYRLKAEVPGFFIYPQTRITTEGATNRSVGKADQILIKL